MGYKAVALAPTQVDQATGAWAARVGSDVDGHVMESHNGVPLLQRRQRSLASQTTFEAAQIYSAVVSGTRGPTVEPGRLKNEKGMIPRAEMV
jgi:hypothetical protein